MAAIPPTSFLAPNVHDNLLKSGRLSPRLPRASSASPRLPRSAPASPLSSPTASPSKMSGGNNPTTPQSPFSKLNFGFGQILQNQIKFSTMQQTATATPGPSGATGVTPGQILTAVEGMQAGTPSAGGTGGAGAAGTAPKVDTVPEMKSFAPRKTSNLGRRESDFSCDTLGNM